MQRLFIPTNGATDWRRFLADRHKQWRRGKSAYELAVAFEAAQGNAQGILTDIAKLLGKSASSATQNS